MKSLAFFTVFFLLVHLSLQIPKLINCPPEYVLPDSMKDGCGSVECEGRNSITIVRCGSSTCLPEKHVGYKQENNSLPYPDCCGGPICAE